MSNVIEAVRRVPRAFARMLAVAGLSLAAIAADAPAAAAQPQQLFSDPTLASYRLTSANLTKFVAATQALHALEGEDFDMDEHFDSEDPESFSIARIAAAFDREPRVRGAINGAGMSTRDYVTFLFATMQAMFGSVMVQMGGENALAEMPNGVLKQNIQFFMEHQEEFEALDMDG